MTARAVHFRRGLNFFTLSNEPFIRSFIKASRTLIKWVRLGPLTPEATVSNLRTTQAGAVVFLKSEPGPVSVVSARPSGPGGGA